MPVVYLSANGCRQPPSGAKIHEAVRAALEIGRPDPIWNVDTAATDFGAATPVSCFDIVDAARRAGITV